MERSTKSSEFLKEEELFRITTKIAGAETMTSAEIKVVIAEKSHKKIEKTVGRIFKKYKLHKTALRNCVLILLVTSRREFLVYGDRGIHEKVGDHFWAEIKANMQSMLAENRVGDAICMAIHMVADRLGYYFPFQDDDVNEISNNVEFEK